MYLRGESLPFIHTYLMHRETRNLPSVDVNLSYDVFSGGSDSRWKGDFLELGFPLFACHGPPFPVRLGSKRALSALQNSRSGRMTCRQAVLVARCSCQPPCLVRWRRTPEGERKIAVSNSVTPWGENWSLPSLRGRLHVVKYLPVSDSMGYAKN